MPRILLVDDDRMYTTALSRLLKPAGHQIAVANAAADAIAVASTGTFDVAFLDLKLPDADGLATLDQLTAVDPLLPVICLTGSDSSTTIVQAMRKGAVDYLTKPVDGKTLANAIASASLRAWERRAGIEGSSKAGLPIGSSPVWNRVMGFVHAAAAAPKTTVLLTGDPGVGKEVVADLLHRLSKRSSGPLVSANAACFSASLMESELFGHEAGAFTGAVRKRKGLFEQADGGVLFLDEIAELPLDLQSKLLRVLEGHPFRRVGGEAPVHVDVRLVAATNRDLQSMVKAGLFRTDLYERLRVFEIRLPPLRERKEDIPHLAYYFLTKIGPELGIPNPTASPEAIEVLSQHDWPGNVRELRNVVERALVLAGKETITQRHLPRELWDTVVNSTDSTPVVINTHPEDRDVTLEHITKRHIVAIFNECDGNLTRAANRLGMSRLTLRRRLQQYGLKPIKQ
ncbi:MAG: sigma-54 dependent transcriptional regulator [Myxococcaceae bacterium]|nr:sigma-54 dependent transcriptional regulator [Myxococcaceae bacterium]